MFIFGGYVLPFPTVVDWMKKHPFFANYNIEYELTCKSAPNDWLDDQNADERIYVQGVDRKIRGEPVWHIFISVHEVEDPKAPLRITPFVYEEVPDITKLEAWLKQRGLDVSKSNFATVLDPEAGANTIAYYASKAIAELNSADSDSEEEVEYADEDSADEGTVA
jgi:hypothetical protein